MSLRTLDLAVRAIGRIAGIGHRAAALRLALIGENEIELRMQRPAPMLRLVSQCVDAPGSLRRLMSGTSSPCPD